MKFHLKNILTVTLFTFTLMSSSFAKGESLGENFSLEGTLALFKKADSPEHFEQLLNTKDQYVNNLDLNEDGQIDYVRVMAYQKEEVHALVLQVPINEKEVQDIAVIEIEKTGKEAALLQIIGDELIFGKSLIVEPYEEVGVSGGKGGPSVDLATMRVIVNVWAWPSVRFVYGPRYRVWRSPFRFGVYPTWYRAWRPVNMTIWRPRVVRYQPRYRVVTTHRVARAHRVYTPVRTTSRVVTTRTTTRVTKTPNGNTVVSRKTTTKAGAKRANGKTVVGKKTNTSRSVKSQNRTANQKKTTRKVVRNRKN